MKAFFSSSILVAAATTALLASIDSSTVHGFTVQKVPYAVSLKKKTVSSRANRRDASSPSALFFFQKAQRIEDTVAAAEVNDDEDGSWTDFGKNRLTYAYAGAWVALMSFAFVFAPGSFGSTQDSAMLQSVMDNPTAPDMNSFFYGIFNLFAIIPIVLACTIAPRASDKGIPAGPTLFLSAFVAFFIMGPYLALRKDPKTVIDDPSRELGWLTRNLWENKLFNYGTLAFGILCLASGAPGLENPAETWKGMQELLQTSKFASVSMADLSLITLILTKEVADDYRIRCAPENEGKAAAIGASTALLPILGTAIYCALRPPLIAVEEEE